MLVFPATGKRLYVKSNSKSLNRITSKAELKGVSCIAYNGGSGKWIEVWKCNYTQ